MYLIFFLPVELDWTMNFFFFFSSSALCKTNLTFYFCLTIFLSLFGLVWCVSSAEEACRFIRQANRRVKRTQKLYAIKCRDYFRRLLRWHYHSRPNRLKRAKKLFKRKKRKQKVIKEMKQKKTLSQKQKKQKKNMLKIQFVLYFGDIMINITHFVVI